MLRFNREKNGGTNQFSIACVKLSYPQAPDMADQATKVLHLPPNRLAHSTECAFNINRRCYY
ncbi:MAG: hypothetical protein H7Z72_13885 [Bacteroidetes bacterium]|nr:hypothetical protein [Fibrella sp.]